MTIVIMEQKRIKVRLTENSPYSDYGYYEKGDIGYIDGYVNDNAVIILENGKFAKADLRWIEVVNEEDKNVNTELAESEDERIRKQLLKHLREVASGKSLELSTTDYERWANWVEKQGEQKPAWSEEDERMYNRIVSFIPQHLTAESYTACINWLKSLRHQSYWKPSDEQMKSLDNARHSNPFNVHVLDTLFHDLEKIKGVKL